MPTTRRPRAPVALTLSTRSSLLCRTVFRQSRLERVDRVRTKTRQKTPKDTSSSNKKDAYTEARRVLQSKLRAIQNSWFSRKADEIEAYADSKNLKRFYTAIKEVYGPQSTGTSPLLSSDGSTLITDKPQILQRWAEHFHNVLNRLSSISDTVLAQLPQIEVNTLLADPPSLLEVNKAIEQMKSGKAPNADSIPSEVFKSGGLQLTTKLCELFQNMWEKETIPQDFRDAIIVSICKRKGSRQCCDNHRGISLVNCWENFCTCAPEPLGTSSREP